MADTKIRFTAEGIQGVHSEMQKILEEATKISSVWEESGQKIIDSLRQQISLLEDRNRKATPLNFTPSTQTSQLTPSTISSGAGDPLMRDLTKSLQEFLETLQETGIKLDQTSIDAISGRGPGGTPDSNKPGSNKPEQDESRDKFLQSFALANLLKSVKGDDPVESLLGIGSNIGSALMMAGKGPIGLIVQGISELLQVRYNAIKSVAPEATDSAKLFGGNYVNYIPRNEKYEDWGIMKEDQLRQMNLLGRSLGRSDLGNNLDESFIYQKGRDISQEDIMRLARIGRGDKNFSIGSEISSLVGGLKFAGLDNGEVDTKISEYLKILTELGQEQVEILGDIDMSGNRAMLSALTSIGGVFKNPDALKNIVGGIDSGLKNASTKQIEALQFHTLSQLYPEKSYYDLRVERSRGIENKEYTQAYINNLMGIGVDTDDKAFSVLGALFKGDDKYSHISKKLVESFGTDDWNKTYEEALKIQPKDQTEVLQNLTNTISQIDINTAIEQGMKIGNSVTDIARVMKEVGELMKSVDSVVKDIKSSLPKTKVINGKPHTRYGLVYFEDIPGVNLVQDSLYR